MGEPEIFFDAYHTLAKHYCRARIVVSCFWLKKYPGNPDAVAVEKKLFFPCGSF